MIRLRYIKLFESFDPFKITNAPAEEVFTKESFDYLCGCLNYVARAATGETEYLRTKQPIVDLTTALGQFGQELGFEVDINKKGTSGSFVPSLEHSYDFLKAINKFVNFTSPSSSLPALRANQKNYQPSQGVSIELKKGYVLIENISNQFRLHRAGKVGFSDYDIAKGDVRGSHIASHTSDVRKGGNWRKYNEPSYPPPNSPK